MLKSYRGINMERIAKVIANTGYCSRRKAEELISQGKVMVNGEKVVELGTKVEPTDIITISGKIIKREEKEYYLLYKPSGVVTTTSDEKNRKTVVDLIETDKRIYPVGRLDYDTTGVLLLTNDGEFANIMMHPKSKVEKVYLAKLEGIIKGEQINKLKDGIVLDNVLVKPTRVKLKKVNKDNNNSMVEITIHEGKNHQVKKMFEAIGYNVLKLKRESISFLTLDGVKAGSYRELSIKEVKKLYGER
jgi:23S rRNA pseudouridine2605 synthase